MSAAVDRATLVTYAALLVVAAVAWVVMLSSPMGAEDMAGMEMTMTPTVYDGVAFVVGWAIMMAAMMLPSALPMIGLYAVMQRNDAPTTKIAAIALFVLMYAALWALTGVPVSIASVGLMAVSPATLAHAIAAVLIGAGVFQLSPLKQVCLRHCRSPLGFLLGHWRPGWRGAVSLGSAHALYCVGCCWALMVVLVVAGAMGLPWVLLIACVVAAEKILPRGEWIARTTGIALTLLGVVVALQPGLASVLRAPAR